MQISGETDLRGPNKIQIQIQSFRLKSIDLILKIDEKFMLEKCH